MATFYFTSMAVNLDITTMIAYVSSLTNGGCGFSFEVLYIHVCVGFVEAKSTVGEASPVCKT